MAMHVSTGHLPTDGHLPSPVNTPTSLLKGGAMGGDHFAVFAATCSIRARRARGARPAWLLARPRAFRGEVESGGRGGAVWRLERRTHAQDSPGCGL